MEPHTFDRGFHKQDVIDGFTSVIWTERYYGDSEVEITVPATTEMIKKLPVGTFIGIDTSSEVMIGETVNIKGGSLKFSGVSLLTWLNNRFVRASANHEDRYWYLSGHPVGQTLWDIVYNMCVVDSPYLNGTINTGITDPEKLAIPGLGLDYYDSSGDSINVGVPYGPVYDALREIATTYEIGMEINLLSVTDAAYSLGFRSYKGLDRTSSQSVNPAVRFSPQMDSFANIEELQSIAALKTLVYAFAPGNPDGLATGLAPGSSSLTGPEYTGFDLRALQVFAEDITTDMVGTSASNLLDVLNSRARDGLNNNQFIITVDGEIVPDNQFKYGTHYNLGDIIEVQGNSGAVQIARITEYIRSQDRAGEKAYPTVTRIG